MKQPKYTRGSYKQNPLKQWSVRVHEHEKELVKEFIQLCCFIIKFLINFLFFNT